VIEILETVSLSPRGVTLAELATSMNAAKSSVQELTNGLLARGYLIEEERRFHLGPGPFILAARANKLAALSLDHEFVAELGKVLGWTVLVGVRVGDAIVFTDLVGEESPSLTFVARTHARRPLYTSAAGKTLLANVPDDEMYRFLDLAGPEQAGEVRQFLVELPEIRSRRLAFNRGVTFADAFAVATPAAPLIWYLVVDDRRQTQIMLSPSIFRVVSWIIAIVHEIPICIARQSCTLSSTIPNSACSARSMCVAILSDSSDRFARMAVRAASSYLSSRTI
jgi:DNA-binding IclR family transcriptional regulator